MKEAELSSLTWSGDAIKIIDQRQLPGKLNYLRIENIQQLWQAIKSLAVRGAPALGVAGAFGVYLGIKDYRANNFSEFHKKLRKVITFLGSCRPTAKNLFWGMERVYQVAMQNQKEPVFKIKKLILEEAKKIIQEERLACRKIGFFGNKLIKNNASILTICNTGILATVDYGTALGVVYYAQEKKKKIRVYACETRPLLQGARLTCWELRRKKVDVTLICDNMAAFLMQQKKIDLVIAGADRIAANGDTANKIGTYNLAVLSKYHRIPFYIAAPVSTFDLQLKTKKDIPIEQRSPDEVSKLFFKRPMAASGVKIYNPAFDLTPHELISAFITDKGIIRPPYPKNIQTVIA